MDFSTRHPVNEIVLSLDFHTHHPVIGSVLSLDFRAYHVLHRGFSAILDYVQSVNLWSQVFDLEYMNSFSDLFLHVVCI